MTNKNLDYYNFLHECAKNSRSVQWLWSTPDRIIAAKLAQKFPYLDPKTLQKFLKNLKYIKKEKKKKNSEKNPLAIIYYLKNKKQISKMGLSMGKTYETKKPIKILIDYPLCLKENELLTVKQHELCHAKFEYLGPHYPVIDYASIKEIIMDNSSKSKIDGRLDEVFRDEFLAYTISEKKLRILLDYQVGRYLNENYINFISWYLRQTKMKNKRKYFKSYYGLYLKQSKLKPLYLYLAFHEFNHLKNKYPKNYPDHFFNLLAPLSCAQFIARADKKTIKKYKAKQKKFISYFKQKACLEYRNDPDNKKIKKVYQKLLTEKNITNLFFYNSHKLLKSLLLIFIIYSMDKEKLSDELFFDQLLDLIIQSYQRKQLRSRCHYKPLILEMVRIKKRYLSKDDMYCLDYLEHLEELLKNSYI